ncbi:Transcription factor [Hirschfeldia incana]|nr:Transcription factor [Hirschfeldia incana]
MRDLGPNVTDRRPHQGVSLPFTMMIPSVPEYMNGQRRTSQEDDGDGHNKSKKSSPWGRVKWMDKMVKLMITALSYLDEEDHKHARKGKWRSVSEAMGERGYHVSPQQCEDKFNDLNKRYKKLNEMLGRGTCCDVVENPALLDKIGYLDEKEKDEVRKIMSSKHLFYEEMCSYHNGNKLHLPPDPALQRSLLLRLRCREGDEHGKHQNEYLDAGDDCEEYNMSQKDCGEGYRGASLGGALKRLRRSQNHEDLGYTNHANKGYVPHLHEQWTDSMSLELEERKLLIQAELMELERQRIKWERFSQKRDQKLQRMRMENENMKLENEKMKLALRGSVEWGARF